MDGGDNGIFTLIMDGTNSPGQLSYTVSNLIPNTIYRFKVAAVNYNGEGPMSPETLIETCSAPQNLGSPRYVTSTQ